MSLFMLHTDIAADLIQGKSPALDTRIAATAPRELCISAVTRGELLCGLLEKSPRSKASPIDQSTAESVRKITHAALAALTPHEAKVLRKRFGIDMIDMSTDHTFPPAPSARVLDQFFTRVRCLPWDEMAATHFASIAIELHRSGIPLGSMDTMIAGHAIAVGAVLVTNNESHFVRIPGLSVENWTAG
jgi:predicted nucleic acid-binding protein